VRVLERILSQTTHYIKPASDATNRRETPRPQHQRNAGRCPRAHRRPFKSTPIHKAMGRPVERCMSFDLPHARSPVDSMSAARGTVALRARSYAPNQPSVDWFTANCRARSSSAPRSARLKTEAYWQPDPSREACSTFLCSSATAPRLQLALHSSRPASSPTSTDLRRGQRTHWTVTMRISSEHRLA